MQDALYHSYINGHVPLWRLSQRILMTDILKIDDKTIPKFPNTLSLGITRPETKVILAPERFVKLDPRWKSKNGQWRTRSEINFVGAK